MAFSYSCGYKVDIIANEIRLATTCRRSEPNYFFRTMATGVHLVFL